MPSTRYLPDAHPFEHIATAHWPLVILPNGQWDWISAVDQMEAWLTTHIGHHWSDWAYHSGTSHDYWLACIAFRKPTYKTLFLLQWT
jgi:saccharopine dehydrogenase-like NADP-dependent oxidoreductase